MGSTRNDSLNKAFGINMKKLRESKEITQEELSGRCNLALSQVGRIERGLLNPTLGTMHVIAKGLGVDLKTICDFEFVE